jgi:NADH:ubiquinone oxidoreductase subunit 6 (subunit J)
MKVSGIAKRTSEALGRFLDRRGTAWGVGVVMPPIMLLLDPVVFRGTFDQALLGRYRTCCYLAIGIAVSALVVVLTGGKARAYLSGIMAAAAGFGFLLGVAILPFSLIGILVLGIGLLGLSPFLAAAVFARWSWRTLRESAAPYRRISASLGAVTLCAVCLGTQVTVSRLLDSSLHDILAGNPRESSAATRRLQRWRLLVDMDQFIGVWTEQSNPDTKRRLAEAYMAITGEDLEEHAARAAD